jgi:glycerol uptake facilitator-like aquaporin
MPTYEYAFDASGAKQDMKAGDFTLRGQLFAEALGTSVLAFVACSSSASPLVLGVVLTVLVYSLGKMSGGHFNPAVTGAMVSLGKMPSPSDYGEGGSSKVSIMPTLHAFLYMAMQFGGAFLGAWLQHSLLEEVAGVDYSSPEIATGLGMGAPFIMEVMFTFLLVYTILNATSAKDHEMAALSIGGMLFVGATLAGPISGGALNPALGVAIPAILKVTKDAATYVIGPLVGGMLAAGIFALFGEKCE